MRYIVILSALYVLFFISTVAANQVSVNFCIDTDDDYWCNEEFTKLVEFNATDMDLLEIALGDELRIDDWQDALWAVSIESYDYDLLPQFDGPEEVYLEEGDNVYIWWTGWQWYSSCTSPASSEA